MSLAPAVVGLLLLPVSAFGRHDTEFHADVERGGPEVAGHSHRRGDVLPRARGGRAARVPSGAGLAADRHPRAGE